MSIKVFEDQNDLVPTSSFPYAKFPFEFFNPVQSRIMEFYHTNENCLVASGTGSGKTISAEIFMAHQIFHKNKKVIYTSPLRTLTQEKFDEWNSSDWIFKDCGCSIISGDYRITSKRMQEIENAKIIATTCESLNSRARNDKSEASKFILDAGAIVIDECFPGTCKVRVDMFLEMKIKDICENETVNHVLSYDHVSGKYVQKRILRKIVRKRENGLVRIKHQNGKFTCTDNHKIWTQRGYVRACELTTEDELKFLPSPEFIDCPVCDRKFKDKVSAFSHYKYGHVLKGQNANHPSQDCPCKKCGKNINIYGLSSHEKHCGEPKVNKYIPETNVCKICGKEFKNARSRAIHERHHNMTQEYYDRVANSVKNSEKAKESRKKMGLNRRGKNNPIFRNPESFEKFKKMGKKRWDSLTDEQKQEQINRFINAPKNKNYDTKLEIFIEELVKDKLPIRKTSNGKFWVTFPNGKKKNPDFKVTGQRKVIEVGDIEYWHTMEEIDETVSNYRKIGIQCLYLTNKDIEKGSEYVYNMIEIFVNNHSSKVISVKKWGGQFADYVYDLEVEENHNYFAQGVLVSNCHSMSQPSRGSHIESAIIKINKINPNIKFILLSGTFPNSEQCAKWISNITGRDTNVLKSTYRPVKLNIHFPTYKTINGYDDNEESKVSRAMQIVDSFTQDKFLIFVHGKRTGEMMLKRLRSRNIASDFHNGDLSTEDRLRIENGFVKNDIRILVATPTLASGRNLPARRVIILGVHRGKQEVDNHDILQQIGRAGRPKYDKEGDAYVLLPDNQALKQKERILKPEIIRSQLSEIGELAFHIVSEIHHKEITTTIELESWYLKTFAHVQRGHMGVADCHEAILRLKNANCIKINGNDLEVTPIGAAASMFYFDPFDVSSMAKNITTLINSNKTDTLHWAFALSCTPSCRIENPTVAEAEEIERWYDNASVKKTHASFSSSPSFNGEVRMAFIYYKLMSGESYFKSSSLNSIARNVKNDFERTSEMLDCLDKLSGKWKISDVWKELRCRVIYGVEAKYAPLVRLTGIGKVKATKLYEAGLTNLDLISRNKDVIIKTLKCKPETADVIAAEAHKLSMTSGE